MSPQAVNQVLNRVLVLHHRSLPMYLNSASPWWPERDRDAGEVLGQIVRDQQHITDRIAALITANGGTIEYGEFPIRFSALHDLSGEFLLAKMIDYQHRSIAALEKYVIQLSDQPRAHAVAQHALGMARAHLDMLHELAQTSVQA